MVNLNLICIPSYEIGMMGVLLFVGQALGAIFLTHWADVFGRKATMIFHGSVYAILVMMCCLDQSLMQVYINIFFIGLLFVPRSACIFTYAMEITPDYKHDDMMFAVYLGDGITFVISGIWTKYTRDVYGFLVVLGAATLVCVAVLVYYLPESPRFLYSTKQYSKLREYLIYLRNVNRVES
jgi:putative MFS transporter